MNRSIHRNLFLLLILLLSGSIINAQEQPTNDQLADKYFVTYQYSKAIPIYQKISKRKSTNPVVFYRLGYSYQATEQYQQAIDAYGKYLEKKPQADSIWERVGDLSKTLGKYEEAKTAYQKVTSQSPLIKDKTAGCDSAITWIKTPTNAKVTNLTNLNTSASDWGAVYYGQEVVFVSDSIRKDVFSKKRQDTYGWTGRPYLKIYQTSSSTSASTSSSPSTSSSTLKDFSSAINDSKFHTGPVVFSKNQDTVYYTVTDLDRNKTLDYTRMGYRKGIPVGTRKLELYYRSKQADGSWGDPKQIGWENTKNYSVGLAALSRDGQTLYFASDMPGGQGQADIWYSKRTGNGEWGTPQNCGPQINTAGDELFPTVNEAGTLYFSSEGHAGMGGLDVYRAKGADKEWQAAENLKSPVNTSYDDFYMVCNEGGCYLSSNRQGGKGNDDIYQLIPASEPPPVAVTPQPQPQPQPKPEVVFTLDKVYYDFDKYNIRPDAAQALDELAAFLRQESDQRVELRAHTDSRGPAIYNQWLSDERAKSAKKYLVKQGIDASRMETKGFGETQLVNGCSDGVKCTPQQHQLNRRLEVKMLTE